MPLDSILFFNARSDNLSNNLDRHLGVIGRPSALKNAGVSDNDEYFLEYFLYRGEA